MIVKPTYAARFTWVGTSKALIIPKDVRNALKWVPGDLVIMRMFDNLLICRRLDPKDIVDVETVPTDAIPKAVLLERQRA